MVFPGSRRRSQDLLSLWRVRMESREWDMGAFGIWEFLGYGSRVSLGISTPSSPAWNSPGIPLELRPSRAVPHCGMSVSMECWAPFSLCHGFGKELENPRRLLPALGSSRGFFWEGALQPSLEFPREQRLEALDALWRWEMHFWEHPGAHSRFFRGGPGGVSRAQGLGRSWECWSRKRESREHSLELEFAPGTLGMGKTGNIRDLGSPGAPWENSGTFGM